MSRVVLASASPRRLDLLRQIGLAPLVAPADVDETLPPELAPADAARHLAQTKAEAVRNRLLEGRGSLATERPLVVLAADTIVAIDGDPLGKPLDEADARAMLRRLSGRTHHVHTGVCVVTSKAPEINSAVATTAVTMRELPDEEIAAYVATGEGADAAGAYAIQGRAAVFVTAIDGDYSNVVGLPLALVGQLLANAGIAVHRRWAPR